MRQTVIGVILAAVVTSLGCGDVSTTDRASASLAPSALSKGKPAKESISVVLVSDADGDGVISHGDWVSFPVSVKDEWYQVQLVCYQNEVIVGASLRGSFYDAPSQLVSRSWVSGAASCRADLQVFQGQITTVASVAFDVAE